MLGKWPLGKIPLATMPEDVIRGVVSVTEDDDTLVAAGALPINGSLSATEHDDSLDAIGVRPISGDVDATEQDDALAATGRLLIKGAVDVTEDDDTPAIAADISPPLVIKRWTKARYEAPPLLTARHEQPPVMKARREPRTFKAQRLAA